MESLEEIKARVEAAVPGAKIEIVPNPRPANQPSLLLDHEHARAVAQFLRDDPALRLDHCSNVTGVDWPDRKVTKKVKVKKVVDGAEKEVEESAGRIFPGLSGSGLSPFFDGAEARAGDHPHANDGSRRRRASAFAHSDLAQRRIPGARNLRSLRDQIRWPSRSAPHPDVG